VTSRLHLAAGAALAASSMLGIGVRTRRLDLRGRTWIHHALYATALGTTVGAALTDARDRRPTWPTAAATLAVLATLPATSGGSRSHVAVAALATATYALGTARTLTR
jgi:hypothetical protein